MGRAFRPQKSERSREGGGLRNLGCPTQGPVGGLGLWVTQAEDPGPPRVGWRVPAAVLTPWGVPHGSLRAQTSRAPTPPTVGSPSNKGWFFSVMCRVRGLPGLERALAILSPSPLIFQKRKTRPREGEATRLRSRSQSVHRRAGVRALAVCLSVCLGPRLSARLDEQGSQALKQ